MSDKIKYREIQRSVTNSIFSRIKQQIYVFQVLCASLRDNEAKNTPHQFSSEHQGRQNMYMYTADLSTLLRLCDDIESNPGPTDRDVDPPTQNQETDEVGIETCTFQNHM